MDSLLRTKRTEVIAAWLERATAVYSDRAAESFRKLKDPFANPVGVSLKSALGPLYDGLLEDAPREALAEHLDRLIQVRCVQEMSPSEAISFIFELKEILRGLISPGGTGRSDLQALEARIDRLGLWAFDSYADFRERIYKIRVREVQGRVSTLMKMYQVSFDDEPTCMPAKDPAAGRR